MSDARTGLRTPLEKAPDPSLGSEPVPKERYTSPEFARLEQERLWRRVWLLAGCESDAPEPGDYFTFEIGPESILVVRQRSGELAARHNVCMHRGNRLREPGRGHAGAFECAFHGWRYDLDGSLVHVTDAHCFPQGTPRSRLDLRPVHCDTWGGFVWVNLASHPEPLRDFLGVLPEHLDVYHFEEQSIIGDVTLEVACNWKTSVDAFNEAYHVQATHPELLLYSDDVNVQIDCYERHSRFLYPLAVTSPRVADPEKVPERLLEHMRQMGVDVDAFRGGPGETRAAVRRAVLEKHAPALGADFSELNEDQLVDDYHYSIFPNVTLNIHAQGTWVFRHRPHPTDPNQMYFDFINLLRAPKSPPPRPEHEHHRPGDGFRLADFTPGGDVLDEDMHNLPRIQAGMNSSAFSGLHLGTQELRIRHFHRTLESYLDGSGRRAD